MNYRREIDGLRAVAVLPVILFHAGFDIFSGGYIGVDVFFVISGYLISSILINDLKSDDFSIVRFYERRARRILPALTVVMLACLPFAYLWMVPSQLEQFAESLFAVSLFLSNWLFWSETGYFAASNELKPLLHTWSLAVEEQFYLVFPPLLFLVWRLGQSRMTLFICLLAILSLLLAEWGWRNEPEINYYFTLSRFWELLAGSICALLSVGGVRRSSDILAALGLALIAFSILFFDESTPFPSVYTLVPVIGAALIILFGSRTLVAQILSMRAFVGIGLISYSAYLWHQPLFAFARIRSIDEPSQGLMSILAVATLVLAWLTWHFVEQPFRSNKGTTKITRRGVFMASGAAAVFFMSVGLAGHLGKGFDWRFDDKLLPIFAAEEDRASRRCNLSSFDELPSQPVAKCLYADEGQFASVMLWGDSHSLAISEELGAVLSSQDIAYYNVSYSGCIPILGLRRLDKGRSHECNTFNVQTLEYARTSGVSTIVLTSRFPAYLTGGRFDNGEGGVESSPSGAVDVLDQVEGDVDDAARQARVLAVYEKQIKELSEFFNVVLVYPIPEAGWNVPIRTFKTAYFNSSEGQVSTSYLAYERRTEDINQLFDKLVNDEDSIFGARVQDVLCKAETGRCVNADEDGIYYRDDDHLSSTGARLVAPLILEQIEATLGPSHTSGCAMQQNCALDETDEIGR